MLFLFISAIFFSAAESHDVLACNCNNFTDAVSVFLLQSHIPQEILQQVERVMSSAKGIELWEKVSCEQRWVGISK